MGAIVQELFSLSLYKRNQGVVARQVTFAAVWIIVALGAWRLNVWLDGRGSGVSERVIPALLIFGLGSWSAFRLVQYPKFADFLISVQGEMGKVTWPRWGELVRASIVVLVVIFFLAGLLFLYDTLWRSVFGWLLG